MCVCVRIWEMGPWGEQKHDSEGFTNEWIMSVCLCFAVCAHVVMYVYVCVADCMAPPAQGIGVKREVFRLSGGEHCLTPIRSNEIAAWVRLCMSDLGGEHILIWGCVSVASETWRDTRGQSEHPVLISCVCACVCVSSGLSLHPSFINVSFRTH